MGEITLEPFSFKITYVHDDGENVVGIRRLEKKVIFLNVAHADKSCLGAQVFISTAKMISESECPPKFYKPYGILDPHEYGWRFQRLVTGSVVFENPPPFREIPIAKNEVRNNIYDTMKIGTVWSNGKQTWVIKDIHVEKLAGQAKLRLWITDTSGKRGQAVYAESIFKGYKIQNRSNYAISDRYA